MTGRHSSCTLHQAELVVLIDINVIVLAFLRVYAYLPL
jgi:hypothetical protein